MASEELTEVEESVNPIDYLAILAAIISRKKLIFIIVISATALSVVVSYLLPLSFLATAVILPETEKSKMAGLGGLSDLAALAGVNVGSEGGLVKLYPTIIKSETVLKNVIYQKYQTVEFPQPVNLIEYWKIKGKTKELEYESALKSLRDILLISVDNKTLVITLSLSMPEPQLAADILNQVISELDKFIRDKRTTSAGQQRKFVEGRLKEVERDLTRSENSLKEFREKNRVISSSPQLLLEQERLIRDVQINSTLYTELRKQYELIKIEEVKNIPVINVMDPARAPAKKDKPKRSVIVLSVFFLSVISSTGYVLLKHQYGEQIWGVWGRLRLVHNR